MDVALSCLSMIDTKMVLVGVVSCMMVYLMTYKRNGGYKNLPPKMPTIPFINISYVLINPTAEKLSLAVRKVSSDVVLAYAGPIVR